MPRKWLSSPDSCSYGGGGGRPGARWRCGRERELAAAAGRREPARGPPGEAGECGKLGVGPPAASASGLWRLWRFSPAPAPVCFETGYGKRVARAPRPKRGWMELGRPTPVLQAQGHQLRGPSGKRRAPRGGGEGEGPLGGGGVGLRTPAPSPPRLAPSAQGTPFPGLDPGAGGKAPGKQLFPSWVCGAILLRFRWLCFCFLNTPFSESIELLQM